MMTRYSLTLLAASLLAAGISSAQDMSLLSSFATKDSGGEIVSWTQHMNTVSVTYSGGTDGHGVQILSLDNTGTLSQRGFVDLGTQFGGSVLSVSSVANDPLGRGFGVATIIPTANTSTAGLLAFFNYTDNSLIGTVNVGFHPDSVTFSQDGSRIVVVNEGEFNASVANPSTTGNAPGSISLLDVSSITSGNLASLTSTSVNTFDFSASNLGAGVSLAGIRNSSIAAVGISGTFINAVPDFNTLGGTGVGSDPDFYKGIEPEYATISGNKVIVSLQENNAVGVFDTTSLKWEKVYNLSTITQTIDASDQDGAGGVPARLIDDTVKGLPMPDTIKSYTVGPNTYFVTANEGDARVDDRDISRLGDIAGNDSMNVLLDDTNFANAQTGVRANDVIGRLNVSRLNGDTNGDGDIDEAVMIGTRSFSIWDAATGALVFDSGSLESVIAAQEPNALLHNINNGLTSLFDTRSDDKGPEPEALTIANFGGKTYAFIGLERQTGFLLYDITNPLAPSFVDYVNALNFPGSNLAAPESLVFIPASESPTGTDLLLGGFEGYNSGGIINEGIGVFAVPEPSRALLLMLGLVGLVARRRR
ncbi:MAG: hypothetical protein RL693_1515 [Verrucomicrobiota bacterium]|jgi:hypothetical protein